MLVASKHLKGQFGTPESQRGATVNANRKRLQKLCRPIVQFLDLSNPIEKYFAKRARAEHITATPLGGLLAGIASLAVKQ